MRVWFPLLEQDHCNPCLPYLSSAIATRQRRRLTFGGRWLKVFHANLCFTRQFSVHFTRSAVFFRHYIHSYEHQQFFIFYSWPRYNLLAVSQIQYTVFLRYITYIVLAPHTPTITNKIPGPIYVQYIWLTYRNHCWKDEYLSDLFQFKYPAQIRNCSISNCIWIIRTPETPRGVSERNAVMVIFLFHMRMGKCSLTNLHNPAILVERFLILTEKRIKMPR